MQQPAYYTAAQPAASLLQDLAHVAAIAGIFVALAAGLVAFLAFLASRRTADDAHMHGLFREYLKLRFEHAMALADELKRAPPSSDVPTPEGHLAVEMPKQGIEAPHAGGPMKEAMFIEDPAWQMIAYKLYVLEEMFYWVVRQEAILRRFRLLHSKRKRLERAAFLNTWRATILTHARDNWRFGRFNFMHHGVCYGADFLVFVAGDWSEDAAFREWAHEHKKAESTGATRPIRPERDGKEEWTAVEKPWKGPVEVNGPSG